MSFYPPKINQVFSDPQNIGRMENADAAGTEATFVCGAVLRFYLRIDAASREILETKFKTDGCGFLIAAADVLADTINGRKLVELRGLEDNFLQNKVETALGKFENHRRHCLELALKTLQDAFADFRARQIEEFTGEKALICTCFGVAEETIESLIRRKAVQTIEEVTEACGAGGGCGSCQPLIQDIIDVIRREEF